MQSKQLQLLLIEDDADDAILVRGALPASGDPSYQIDEAAS